MVNHHVFILVLVLQTSIVAQLVITIVWIKFVQDIALHIGFISILDQWCLRSVSTVRACERCTIYAQGISTGLATLDSLAALHWRPRMREPVRTTAGGAAGESAIMEMCRPSSVVRFTTKKLCTAPSILKNCRRLAPCLPVTVRHRRNALNAVMSIKHWKTHLSQHKVRLRLVLVSHIW